MEYAGVGNFIHRLQPVVGRWCTSIEGIAVSLYY
nr:MAG TPA: hypothetical protein [Caudoviricetes sp.]